MQSLKFKLLSPLAQLPTRAKRGDAGLDLVAVSEVRVGFQYAEYGTGLAVEIPEGYVGLVFPRSSVSNKDQILANCVGVIDAGYRGEIKFRFKDLASEMSSGNRYKVGDRIGQLVIVPCGLPEPVLSDHLSDSDRGTGGYGSTGT